MNLRQALLELDNSRIAFDPDRGATQAVAAGMSYTIWPVGRQACSTSPVAERAPGPSPPRLLNSQGPHDPRGHVSWNRSVGLPEPQTQEIRGAVSGHGVSSRHDTAQAGDDYRRTGRRDHAHSLQEPCGRYGRALELPGAAGHSGIRTPECTNSRISSRAACADA